MPAMSNEKENQQKHYEETQRQQFEGRAGKMRTPKHNISLEQNMSTRHRMVDLQVQPEDHRLEH